VRSLLASPRARGLFRKAIVQSGGSRDSVLTARPLREDGIDPNYPAGVGRDHRHHLRPVDGHRRHMERRVERLRQAGTRVECRKFPGVGHGFGLGTGTGAEGWILDAISFWTARIQSAQVQP